MKISIDEKITKLVNLIEIKTNQQFKSRSPFDVTFHIGKYENIIRFDPQFIKDTDITDLEQYVISTGLLNMFSDSENKIISFNKHGANYNQK